MENKVQAQALSRSLGLAECVTITAGAVIGVGLFTVGSQIVGLMGGTVIIASLIAFVLILFPCAMYGELGAALPLAGGTYSFAKRAINYPVAVFESWNYTLAQVGIGASEAMAFSNYFVRLLNALGCNVPVDNGDYSLFDFFNGAGPEAADSHIGSAQCSVVGHSLCGIVYHQTEVIVGTADFDTFFLGDLTELFVGDSAAGGLTDVIAQRLDSAEAFPDILSGIHGVADGVQLQTQFCDFHMCILRIVRFSFIQLRMSRVCSPIVHDLPVYCNRTLEIFTEK